MPRRFRFTDFLGTSPGYNAGAGGESFAAGSAASDAVSRGNLLAELIREGKLSPRDLSAQDAGEAGPKLGTHLGGSLFGKVGGLIGNLGSDIWDASKGLAPGMANSLLSLGGDIGDIKRGAARGQVDLDFNRTRDKVVDPLIQNYEYTYAGKGAPEGSSLLGRIYAHPLGPALDALTLVSGGASAAGKVGLISKTGRAAVPLAKVEGEAAEEGLVAPSITPRSSSRPLRRGIQAITDSLSKRSERAQDVQSRGLSSQQQKMNFSLKESEVQTGIRNEAANPLVGPLSKLDPDEATAFELINRLGGANVAEKAPLLAQAVREGLEGSAPEGQRFADFSGTISKEIPEARTSVSDRAMELASDPAQSPTLMEAIQTYRGRVDERIAPGMSEEDVAAKKGEILNALGERNKPQEEVPVDPTSNPLLSTIEARRIQSHGEHGDPARLNEGIYVDDLFVEPKSKGVLPDAAQPANTQHPFPEPTIMPSQTAEGFQYHEPGRIASTLGQDPQWLRNRSAQGFNPQSVTYQTLFEEPTMTLRPNPDPILAGVQRPDMRQYVDFIAKREREVIEQAYSERHLNEVALKDANGEAVKVPGNWSQQKVKQRFGPDWVAVSPEGRLRFFKSELSAADALEQMKSMGYDVGGPETMARMGAEAEDAAIHTSLGARFGEAWIVPEREAQYQMKLETASDPYKYGAFRVLARAQNFWRTWTLAMMPRWAVNTAVGSAVLNTIKGVGPRDYLIARKLSKGRTYETGPETSDIWLHGTHEDPSTILGEGLKPPEPGQSAWEDANMSNPYVPGAYLTPNQNVAGMFGPNIMGVDTRDLNLLEDLNSDPGKSKYSTEPIPPEKIQDLGSLLEGNWPQDIKFDEGPFKEWALGKFPKEKVSTGNIFDQAELAGVNLGAVHGMELLEPGMQGYLDRAFAIKVGPGSRWIMQKVQGIEDHFRRASFVHSLRRESKQALSEQGNIIENFERSKGARSTDDFLEEVMNNPETVRAAVEDVNRFAYNFATLGPFERRYVRQAIPFWGWYKFISGLAYRLPVDYPGRTNLLAQTGMLATEQQQQGLGTMPAWLSGVIPFGDKKNFSYLSTMGLNPFSQILNPAGPEGLAGGTLQLSQGSPLIQSMLTAYGVDTMRGGEVPISPETLNQQGLGADWWGSLVNTNSGQDISAYQISPGRRLLGSLMRSFPEVRMGERYQSGGRSVFPESLPWDSRYMATKPEGRFGGTLGEVLEQYTGTAVRPFDLQGYQALAAKRALYAKSKNRNDLLRLRRALKK